MSNTFFQGGRKKFYGGLRPLRPPGYGPATDVYCMSQTTEEGNMLIRTQCLVSLSDALDRKYSSIS